MKNNTSSVLLGSQNSYQYGIERNQKHHSNRHPRRGTRQTRKGSKIRTTEKVAKIGEVQKGRLRGRGLFYQRCHGHESIDG